MVSYLVDGKPCDTQDEALALAGRIAKSRLAQVRRRKGGDCTQRDIVAAMIAVVVCGGEYDGQVVARVAP